MKSTNKKNIGLIVLALSFVSLLSEASTVQMGNFKISYFRYLTQVYSVILIGEAGSRLRIDCVDGALMKKANGNTSLSIMANSLPSQLRHEVFDGTNDFYCLGVHKLMLGLKEGDTLDVSVDVVTDIKTVGSEKYEEMSILDLQFKALGESEIRSLKKNPGTVINFQSIEPIL